MNFAISSLYDTGKKKLLLGLVLVMLVGIISLLLTRQEEIIIPQDDIPVELIWRKPDNTENVFTDIVRAFEDLPGNQGVKIKIESPAYGPETDYYRDLLLDFARGRGPDLFTIQNDDIPAFQEFMTPVTAIPGIADSRILADYRTNMTNLVVRETVVRDKIYAVTSYVDNMQLYYNENLLAQAGITNPPATWENMDLQLAELTKRSIDGNSFETSGISLGTGLLKNNGDLEADTNIQNFYDIIPLLIFQNGGQMYDYTREGVIFGTDRNETDINIGNVTDRNFETDFSEDNPAFSSLSFYLSFSNSNSNRYTWNTESKDNSQAFLEGRLAYMLDYSGFQKTIENQNSRLQYKIAELPQLDQDNKVTFGKYMVDGINRQLEIDSNEAPTDLAKAKKLRKAREFLYFMTTEASQEIHANATQLPSAHRSILARQQQGDERQRIFAAGALYAQNYYKPDTQKAERMWGDLVYRIQFENQTPGESLGRAINEYRIMVQQGARIRLD